MEESKWSFPYGKCKFTTTVQETKDILAQYSKDEYLITYAVYMHRYDTPYCFVNKKDLERALQINKNEKAKAEADRDSKGFYWWTDPPRIIVIPHTIMKRLLEEGYVVPEMTKDEYRIRQALEVDSPDLYYLIKGESNEIVE